MDPRGMDNRPRIALLIDADNAQASKIDDILNEVAKYGECNIRRAYGNWKKDTLKGWEGVLLEKAIKPMQQFDYSRGKNASDMALVIDAMELLYTLRPGAFAIVSSDADFTPLVQHLKENGADVYGFGQRKTPEAFTSACTRFLFVETLGEDDEVEAPEEAAAEPAAKQAPAAAAKKQPAAKKSAKKATKQHTTAQLRQDAKLVKLLRDTVLSAADDDGWASVSTVGQRVSNRSSLDTRNYGYGSWSKLLKATELFDFRDEGTSALAVRDKRDG